MNKPQKVLEDSSAFTEENAGFLEALYERFLKDPLSVDPSWRERFGRLQSGAVEPEIVTVQFLPSWVIRQIFTNPLPNVL